ncbi:MAG TPA: branched-chain amino acid ABC transporter permease [Acidimicrobiales bacterium]
MSSSMQFYISNLLVYLGVDVMACLGLNLQFGVAGVINLAFIVFQAAGAYTAAVLTLGPQSSLGGFQSYIMGSHLPFPLPLIAAAVVGGALSYVVGLIVLRRLRTDYQAMVFLVISLIATTVVTNAAGLFNGSNGLALIPKPLESVLNLSPVNYQWVFVGMTFVCTILVWVVVRRITGSPLGRTLRAVRDNDAAAASLGKNVTQMRLIAFVSGGAIAGLSGGILAQYISAWSPGSWLFPESFVYFSAVIVGGAGNNMGAVVGAALVPVAFLEATRYIPQFGYPGLVDALQWVVVGLLTLAVMWFRPRGVFPERTKRFARTPESEPTS